MILHFEKYFFQQEIKNRIQNPEFRIKIKSYFYKKIFFNNLTTFHFKQFSVSDDHAVMKISTDAVLLGAWSNEAATHILDIGTGCGIIALMLAQKTNAKIDAVEIDQATAAEAIQNIKNSTFGKQIHIHPISFQEFILKTKTKYDLIVSNPPYFKNLLKSKKEEKNLAKHDVKLTFEEIIHSAKTLLQSEGKLNIILPAYEGKVFSQIALLEGLYCNKILEVKPTTTKPANRLLMQFSFTKTQTDRKEIIIRRGNVFTDEYKLLTKDYYLKF